MLIPSFDEYKWMNPEQRRLIRQLQRVQGLAVYESRVGIPSANRGQARPQMRGPRPPRPNLWLVGPDEQRHLKYISWGKHKAQALFRGEEYDLAFQDFERAWEGLWDQRGREGRSLCMTRKDWEKPWHKDNIEIVERREVIRRSGLYTKLKRL